MQRYLIERDIPAIGSLEREQIRAAAQKSNDVLKDLGTGIQWVQSFATPDKLFCVYLARDEAIVRDHARISGFPATRIYQVKRVVDPTTPTAA